MGFVAHHLIRFTREALRGEHNASFYAAKAAEAKAARDRSWWETARRKLVPEREAA
jgi:hopanoid C-2 methylase